MARIRINTRTHAKEKPDKFVFFFPISQQGEQNTCMYVSEICAEGIFVTLPWWLENVKSRSKIALFSNERYFEI